jgi:hypothetical protein
MRATIMTDPIRYEELGFQIVHFDHNISLFSHEDSRATIRYHVARNLSDLEYIQRELRSYYISVELFYLLEVLYILTATKDTHLYTREAW